MRDCGFGKLSLLRLHFVKPLIPLRFAVRDVHRPVAVLVHHGAKRLALGFIMVLTNKLYY